MSARILIVAEHDGTKLNPSTAKCVSCARALADAEITVVVLAADAGAVAAQARSSAPAFVEWPSPVMAAKQCQVELENGSGATMRVQLLGYDAADIEALARGFWNAL